MTASPEYKAFSAAWAEQVRRHPSVITRDGLSATVIRTPDRIHKDFSEANYVERIETVVDILRTDYARLDLDINRDFTGTISGVEHTYSVKEVVNDDENEPTIKFSAIRTI